MMWIDVKCELFNWRDFIACHVEQVHHFESNVFFFHFIEGVPTSMLVTTILWNIMFDT